MMSAEKDPDAPDSEAASGSGRSPLRRRRSPESYALRGLFWCQWTYWVTLAMALGSCAYLPAGSVRTVLLITPILPAVLIRQSHALDLFAADTASHYDPVTLAPEGRDTGRYSRRHRLSSWPLP